MVHRNRSALLKNVRLAGMSTSVATPRLPQLDGIRGIAILLVLIWHYFPCQLKAESGSLVAYLARACWLTWSGVDLFFVLSGFLICGILLDHRHSANLFQVFYVRRACRIFPLYFAVIGIFVLIKATSLYTNDSYGWLFDRHYPLWSYATFTQNFFMAGRGDLGAHWFAVTWSLAVEEQFYLIVPLLVYCLRGRSLVLVFAGLVIAAPILRCMNPGFQTMVITIYRSDSLLMGALLAVFVRWPPFLNAAKNNRRILLGIFLVLLAGTLVLTSRFYAADGLLNHLWLSSLYAVLILMAFVGSNSWLGKSLSSPVLVWFGQLSYGIYLLHDQVAGLCFALLRGTPPVMQSWSDFAITCLAFSLTLVVATASWHFFERPILALGHRWKYAENAFSLTPICKEGSAAA